MKRDFKITGASGGAAFTVRIVTRASRTELAGIQDDGSLKIRLTAPPTDGEANLQLVEFLAEILEVHPDQVEIVAGENARNKLISVENIAPDFLEERLWDSIVDDEYDEFDD